MQKQKFPPLAAIALSAAIATTFGASAFAENMFSGKAKPNSF